MQSPAQPDDTTPYDRVEYKGGTIAQTHPTRLATVAALFGLQSAPANRCRVLELGCGDGSNLIPMAFHHPDSEFVGVDLAHTPISVGRDQLDRLKLRNIRLLQGDVTEACEHLGAFDYVIAHGLYSWVPDSVRPHILRVAAERLTGNGVAYVSYNALPGCRLRHLVRDLLGFRFGADAREPTQLEPMREFLRAFSRVEEWSDGKFLDVLKREIAFVQNLPDDVLYHDDLAADSKAFYLRQFVADAGAWGLQYLGEADIVERFTMAGLGEFDALVDAWSNNDWVAREQYFDFVKGRRFRQTLLCKDSQRLLRDFGTHTVERFDLRSRLRLDDANAALFDRSEVSFSAGNRGRTILLPRSRSRWTAPTIGLRWSGWRASARAPSQRSRRSVSNSYLGFSGGTARLRADSSAPRTRPLATCFQRSSRAASRSFRTRASPCAGVRRRCR